MAKLLITDSESFFQSSVADAECILISNTFFKIISRSSHLSESDIFKINDSFIQERLLNENDFFNKLNALTDASANIQHPFISKNQSGIKGIVATLMWSFVEKKNFIEVLLKLLVSDNQYKKVKLHLSEVYKLLDLKDINSTPIESTFFIDKKLRRRITRQKVLNKAYLLFNLKRYLSSSSAKIAKRIIFLVQTAEHHHELLNEVYKHFHKSKEVEPIVVYYPMYLGDDKKFRIHIPKGLITRPIQDFRGLPSFVIPRKFIQSKISPGVIDYPSVEANYTMMKNMLLELEPDVCVTVGYQDTGRYLADVCRAYDTPSVSIDYSFITNDYTFNKEVEYDYKCTISNAQQEVWLKRNDPTHEFEVTGYLKYDKVKESPLSKEKFMGKYNLVPSNKTIFFASSHGYDPAIKRRMLAEISRLCIEQGFNLIVKTHPLEQDGIAKEQVRSKNQIVFSHSDLSAMECVYYSDIVVSPGSSIVLDALYYGKPYITFSYSKSRVITDFMAISSEPFIFKALNIEELKQQIIQLDDETFLSKLTEKMDGVKERYLFKTDRKASQRVIELLERIIGK
ncbi:CDP-glycerol glycerophosphotransferase family protein [Ekhidna sp.]|uniref:CDP-glycerol glycerophosphotransferase family protein n=1 Tax=Ekhidna sp. TaxID=2608089 RepID=UPI00329A3905